MLIYQIFLAAFALSVPILALAVAGRLVWCAVQSVRAAHLTFAALSVLGVVCLAGLFAGVGVVWFGYGVSHSKKDLRTDLVVVLMTGPLFYGASFGLWRMARYFHTAIKSHASQPHAAADPPKAAGR